LSQNVEHHIYGVTRVAKQCTSKFGSPPPTPWIVVVLPRPPPSHLYVKYESIASKFPLNQVFELLQTVAEPILENRHEAATALLDQTRKRIHCGQASNERLFANHVFARFQ